MVRIQGMKRDVTPGLATALGGAGQAAAGAVNMRGEIQRQDAQAQEMALQAEQAQMQRVEFGLATEKLRLGIENARVNMEREKKLRADARVANTASLRAMQRSGGFDALGPEVRAFHEEAIRLAADMEPEAGAKVVAAAGTMIAKADNDVRRQSMLRTVMGSVSTGYWKQAEGVLAFYGETAGGLATQAGEAMAAQAKEAEAALRKEFGAAFDDKIHAARRVLREVADDETIAMLDRTGLGNNAGLIKVLAHAAAASSEAPALKGGGDTQISRRLTPADAKAQLSAMEADEETMKRLMDGSHPGHDEAQARRRRLMADAYPGAAA